MNFFKNNEKTMFFSSILEKHTNWVFFCVFLKFFQKNTKIQNALKFFLDKLKTCLIDEKYSKNVYLSFQRGSEQKKLLSYPILMIQFFLSFLVFLKFHILDTLRIRCKLRANMVCMTKPFSELQDIYLKYLLYKY